MKKSFMLLLVSVMSLLTACKDSASGELMPDAAEQTSESNATEESDFASIKTLNTLLDAKSLIEQTRNKDTKSFLEIINDANASQQQKQEAINNIIALSDAVKNETSVEILLMSKGFPDVVVYLTNAEINIMINATEISEAQRAQTEDIAVRKTGLSPEAIVITLLKDNATEESDSASSINLDILPDAKLVKEQSNEKTKELLSEIIDNPNINEQQKQEAINRMTAISNTVEKETTIEMLLIDKGFPDAMVCITNTGIDVVVDATELSEAQRAQIEDIIIRNTGIAPDTIIICTLPSK